MKNKLFMLVLFLILIGCGPTKEDWIKVKQTNSVAEVKKFLEENPRSKFDFEAKTILDSLEWNNTVKLNTIDGYKSFIGNYPDSKNLNSAKENLNWTKALQEKNDSLLSYCIKTYPNSQKIPEAKDLLSQILFPVYELKKADCLEINSKCMSLSMGLHYYGINNDGSLTYEPDQLPMKMVIIWRDIDSRFTDFFKDNPICTGVAYLYIGPGKFRYLKKVDLNKSDDELAAEFGIKH